MKRLRHLQRRGGALLEAAIVLPVLIVAAFGLTEVGHYFYIKHSLQAAAREGARLSARGNDGDAAVVRMMNAAGIAEDKYTITNNGPDASKGEQVTVTVEVTWQDIGVRPMKILDGSVVVKGEAVMLKEQDPEPPPGPPPTPIDPGGGGGGEDPPSDEPPADPPVEEPAP